MADSMWNTSKQRYLGFITGLRHEMLEPRRGKTEFESPQPQTPQEPLKTFLQDCMTWLGRYCKDVNAAAENRLLARLEKKVNGHCWQALKDVGLKKHMGTWVYFSPANEERAGF